MVDDAGATQPPRFLTGPLLVAALALLGVAAWRLGVTLRLTCDDDGRVQLALLQSALALLASAWSVATACSLDDGRPSRVSIGRGMVAVIAMAACAGVFAFTGFAAPAGCAGLS